MARKTRGKIPSDPGVIEVVNETGPTGMAVDVGTDSPGSAGDVAHPPEKKETKPGKVKPGTGKSLCEIKTYLDEWQAKRRNCIPLSSGEKKIFTSVCEEHGLDPLKGEVFLVESGNPFRPDVVSRQPAISFETFLKKLYEVDGMTGINHYKFSVRRETNPISGKLDAVGESTFFLKGEFPNRAPNSEMCFWYSNFCRDSEYHRKMPNLAFSRVAFAVHARTLFPKELAGLPLIKDEIIETKFMGAPAAISRPAVQKEDASPPPVNPSPPATPPPSSKEDGDRATKEPPVKPPEPTPIPGRDEGKDERPFDVPYPKTDMPDQCSEAEHRELVGIVSKNVHVINDGHLEKFDKALRAGIDQETAAKYIKFLLPRTMYMRKVYNIIEGKLGKSLREPERSEEITIKVCKALWMTHDNEIIDMAENGVSIDTIKEAMKSLGLSLMLLK